MAARSPKGLGVIGGGVIGLSTAAEAVRRGYSVTIYSDRNIGKTTSWKAAASFKPHGIADTPTARRIVERSWIGYAKLLAEHGPKTGVRMHTHWEASNQELKAPWYLPIVKNTTHRQSPEVPGGYRFAWEYETFFIEMPVFLSWFQRHLVELGVKFINRQFKRIEEISALPHGVVVNAAGYGSKTLTGDIELIAVRGQTVLLDLPMPMPWSISAGGFYTYPRTHETLLGGTEERGIEEEESTAQGVKSIIRGNLVILPNIEKIRVKDTAAGIRPCRQNGPRIEREILSNKLLVHNYGHGGAGVTMALGSAEAAMDFVLS